MNNVKIIYKDNLMNNLKKIKKCNKNICAMVKADAYGHGMNNIIKKIKNEVIFFGVANEDEAIKAKKIAPNTNILIVGKSSNFSKVIVNDISFTIDTLSELSNVLKICKLKNKQAKIHIAVNTGMNRIGTNDVNKFKNMLDIIDNNSMYLKLEGVFTHCFDADCSKTHFYAQMQSFYEFVKLVKNSETIIHIGGSFVLNHKIPKFVNMIRVGYFLYGYGKNSLNPVMNIKSKIIKIIECKKGDFVGYGNKINIVHDSKIAVVPIGYADGLPRSVSNKYEVTLNGKKARVIGNICMDMFMIDVTSLQCNVGDEIIVVKDALYLSKQTNTSPYEILTNFCSFRGKSLIV